MVRSWLGRTWEEFLEQSSRLTAATCLLGIGAGLTALIHPEGSPLSTPVTLPLGVLLILALPLSVLLGIGLLSVHQRRAKSTLSALAAQAQVERDFKHFDHGDIRWRWDSWLKHSEPGELTAFCPRCDSKAIVDEKTYHEDYEVSYPGFQVSCPECGDLAGEVDSGYSSGYSWVHQQACSAIGVEARRRVEQLRQGREEKLPPPTK